MPDSSGAGPASVGHPGPTWTGIPQPATAGRQRAITTGSLDRPLAPLRRRAVGWLIDVLVLAVISAIALGVGHVDVEAVLRGDAGASAQWQRVNLAVLIVRVAYQWAGSTIGWTLGKRAVGIRVVDGNGRPPGVWRGLVRAAGQQVSEFAFGAGYLWAVWDRRRQTWHDRAAGTFVVLAAPAVGPPPPNSAATPPSNHTPPGR